MVVVVVVLVVAGVVLVGGSRGRRSAPIGANRCGGNCALIHRRYATIGARSAPKMQRSSAPGSADRRILLAPIGAERSKHIGADQRCQPSALPLALSQICLEVRRC